MCATCYRFLDSWWLMVDGARNEESDVWCCGCGNCALRMAQNDFSPSSFYFSFCNAMKWLIIFVQHHHHYIMIYDAFQKSVRNYLLHIKITIGSAMWRSVNFHYNIPWQWGWRYQERMLTKVGKMQTKRRAYHTLMLDVAIGTYSKLWRTRQETFHHLYYDCVFWSFESIEESQDLARQFPPYIMFSCIGVSKEMKNLRTERCFKSYRAIRVNITYLAMEEFDLEI